MNCSTLQEQAAGSLPSTSQVNLQTLPVQTAHQLACKTVCSLTKTALLHVCVGKPSRLLHIVMEKQNCNIKQLGINVLRFPLTLLPLWFVPRQCNTWESLCKLKAASPKDKIGVTSKSPVGDISVVTLMSTKARERNRTPEQRLHWTREQAETKHYK